MKYSLAIFILFAAHSSAWAHIEDRSMDPSARKILLNEVDGPSALGDSGVKYIAYEKIQTAFESLAREYPTRLQVLYYGKTAQGRSLMMLKISDGLAVPKPGVDRPAVQISGAIHGNEYLGIEAPLAEYFIRQWDGLPGLRTFLAKGGVIYFIPVVNPDGYAARMRANSAGTDLNRDFDGIEPRPTSRFTQPETKLLAQILDSEIQNNHLEFKFSMDYHCCLPAALMPWSYADRYPTRSIDMTEFEAIGTLEKSILGYEAGNPHATVGYNALGTSMDYFYAKYRTIAWAIEGKYGGEFGEFTQHAQFFDEVFARLSR
jgi:succinylglutamate desuccinylase